jgi:Rieske Fe-S protein
MPDSHDRPLPTRRSFLDALLALGLVGFLASLLYPVLRYLRPIERSGPGGPLRLSAEDVTTLSRERFVILRAGARRVLVLEGADDRLRALDAKCTHEGCTVRFVPAEGVIWCACHNGRFDLDGRVISGPPPRPLPRYTATRAGDGVVVTLEPA